MWIFTNYGFFSITKSTFEPGMMQIRARDDRALEQLKSHHDEPAEIIETKTADYRWRILVTPERAVEIIAAEAGSIDYSNFKNACESPQETGPLHEVWSIMQDVQFDRIGELERDGCGELDNLF